MLTCVNACDALGPIGPLLMTLAALAWSYYKSTQAAKAHANAVAAQAEVKVVTEQNDRLVKTLSLSPPPIVPDNAIEVFFEHIRATAKSGEQAPVVIVEADRDAPSDDT